DFYSDAEALEAVQGTAKRLQLDSKHSRALEAMSALDAHCALMHGIVLSQVLRRLANATGGATRDADFPQNANSLRAMRKTFAAKFCRSNRERTGKPHLKLVTAAVLVLFDEVLEPSEILK